MGICMSINNINLIKPLLNFKNEGDFYQLYIFRRKKDMAEEVKNNVQSVRTIKSYSIESIEQLEKRYDEIKMLCEVFQARAYIHLSSQNHKDVALNMINEIINRVKSNQHNQRHVFDSVVGQLKTKEQRWIVDIDTKDEILINTYIRNIERCRPDMTQKVIATIPTKQGVHLITNRFDIIGFRTAINNLKESLLPIDIPYPDIQKKNPTLLYYPNSLEK